MSKLIDLTTPQKRAKLAPQKNPYWMRIAGPRGGVSLGWRQPGRWIAKLVADNQRFEEKLGISDETFGGMEYKSAVQAVLAWAEQKAATDPLAGVLTVGSAVEAYIAKRMADDAKLGRPTAARLKLHVLSDAAFARVPLSKLAAVDIETWRSGMAKNLKATSVNRLLNDTRAALNAAAERHRRALPAHLPTEIRIGTRLVSVGADDQARGISLLEPYQVKRLIEEAFRISDDFGRLVLLVAATGARPSQLFKIKVGDLRLDRVLVPGARKGRAKTAKAAVPIQLSPEVREMLVPAIIGREVHEPLLMRWSFRQDGNAQRGWVKDQRVAWDGSNDYQDDWQKAAKAAGLPEGCTMYWLRHTSIVRELNGSLPVRMVAARHDTSVAMIEQTYGRWIVEADQELGKRVAMRL